MGGTQPMNELVYLFAAYGIVWLGILAYQAILHARIRELEQRIENR